MRIIFMLCLMFGLQAAHAYKGTTADQIWADQKCGGMAAYKEDPNAFNICVAKQLPEYQTKLMWADQKCGGMAAYKADSANFNTCVEAEMNK